MQSSPLSARFNFWSLVLLLSALLLGPASAQAANKKKGAAQDTGVKGSITAIDEAGKSITLNGKVIVADNTTLYTKGGKPIGFADLKVGDSAEISTFALGDKLTAVTVKVSGGASSGAVTPPAATPKKKKKK